MIIDFLTVFKDYFIEVLPALALGFFLSGIVHEFIPDTWVEKYLGRDGIRPILYSSIVGTALPVCCIGALPIAVSFHQKGAKLGPVLAFLVATPATSVTALLVCLRILGWEFTVFIFFAAIIMGLVMGIVGNRIKLKPRLLMMAPSCSGQNETSCSESEETAQDPICGMSVSIASQVKTEYKGRMYYFCCPHCKQKFEGDPEKYSQIPQAKLVHQMRHVIKHAFWDMPKEIGFELLLGLVLAALVGSITPIGDFVGDHMAGGFGYIFSLGFGLIMYICSTASIPLVDSLISQGMASGAGMVMLLVGPITSWGTLLVLRKEFGKRTLVAYLVCVSGLALVLGYGFSFI